MREHNSGGTMKQISLYKHLPISNALMGVIVLNDQELCVHPWEVASNQEPPFYRKVFMETPTVSGRAGSSIQGEVPSRML